MNDDITDFPVPTRDSHPEAITAGPDGNVWFTESSSNEKGIGQITPAGVITEFAVPDPNSVHRQGIAAGPDGNLWFTEAFRRNGIGRITPTGAVTLYPTPNSAPNGIAAGPDGNMWFTHTNGIGKITLTGTIT
ncbi:MAG: hypothetical protein MUD05_08920, partial [Candidatus Nanopelagicales bacterium]|nr:hypothetical protein [Candidatus Nanopelagicales bacterium]